MADGKRLSGGKRATIAKRAAREAARSRAKLDPPDWLAQVAAIGKPPTDPERAHAWLGRAAVLVVHATLCDVALPPEQMRRDAMKQLEQASKVLDPAKLSVQLEELERALEEIHRNASNVETGEDRPASAGTALTQ